MTSGNAYDELISLVVGESEATSVHAVEGDGRRQGEPLVAVDERVIPGERVQERGGFCIGARISIFAKGSSLRPGKRRFQQSDVANRGLLTQDPAGHVQQLRQRQEDHWPSRSSASA